MTDDNDSSGSRFNRRKVLAGLGAGAAAGVAGCTGGDGGSGTTTSGTTADTTTGMDTTEGTTQDTTTGMDTTEGTTQDTTTEDTTTEDTGEITEGGRPTIGLAVAPQTFNVIQAGTVYSGYIANPIHTFGTTTHPQTQDFKAWAFTDWTVNPENATSNPSSPTLTATLRDDLQYHDGESVTTEDYAFTARFMRDQNPSRGLSGAAFQSIPDSNGIRVQSPTEVEIFMKQKDQRWFTSILGAPLLPKHIWQDNASNYQNYSPRNEDEVVGCGPFKLADYNWQNWYEFDRAYDDFPPANADYSGYLRDGAPFIDGYRLEVFGSQSAMEQALLNNEIDGGFVAGGFTVQNAVQAEQSENFTVHQSSESGFNHVSYNLRRKPLDDKGFRQFLNKAMDKTWIVEEPYQGIAAVKGDYVVIPALGRWRPPEPQELAGGTYQANSDFEGTPIPDLSFPNPGNFNLNQDQVNQLRNFLINNPNSEYDYSWGSSYSGGLTRAPDGKEIYINGQTLNEFHTNNNGEGGQGPLVFSFQPPQEDLYQARTGQQYVGLLKLLGVPIEPKVKTINAQIPTVYAQEDFDIYSMGWGVGVNVTYLSSLYSSEGADLDSSSSSQNFNPMGYTGADELIQQDRTLMDFTQRTPVVKQICAEIYHDAPTNITDVAQLLEPTSNEFQGWIGGLGTTIGTTSFLNIAQQG